MISTDAAAMRWDRDIKTFFHFHWPVLKGEHVMSRTEPGGLVLWDMVGNSY